MGIEKVYQIKYTVNGKAFTDNSCAYASKQKAVDRLTFLGYTRIENETYYDNENSSAIINEIPLFY